MTPVGLSVLEATYRGRVSFLVGPQVVVQRVEDGLLDVSGPFQAVAREGWVFIESYDIDRPPFPVEVPCWCTPAGEDVLMEAAAAARKRKAKQ